MADNTVLNPGALGDTIATEDISGVKHELVKVEFGSDGIATKVDDSHPLPVTDAVAEAALASIASEDFATQATLASIDAKMTTIITMLAGLSSIEVSPTFAGISPSTAKRLIEVLVDETNNNDKSLYIYDGTTLRFLQTIA